MSDYFLSSGSHATPQAGRCAMEWVSYLAGEPHSDRPVCVSPVLQSYCIALNDRLPDTERQKLRPYLARTIGTAGDGRDTERVQLLRDWLIRERLPRGLDAAGCHELAEQLRTLPGELTAEAVNAACLRARDEAYAARTKARERLYEVYRERWPAGVVGVVAYADDAAYAAVYAAAAYDDVAYAAVYADDAAYAAVYAAVYAAAAYDAAAKPSLDEIRKRARAAADEALRPLVEQGRRGGFELLERMLPLEPILVPVVTNPVMAEAFAL